MQSKSNPSNGDLKPIPALRFEQDAYSLGTQKILGRQSAGFSFLKAVARLSKDQSVVGFGPKPTQGPIFSKLLRSINPKIMPVWINSTDLAAFQRIGAIHLPDPSIAEHSRLRVRSGTNAYSITGVIHTLASASATKMITDIPIAPLMPWDALVLTSKAAKSAVLNLIGAQEDYLKWKFKTSDLFRPELPIIPLGVHCDEFTFTPDGRTKARQALGLAEDEIAFLYLGRLSFHAKAHPFPMYEALEAAAKKTGKKIVLIQCGWFANEFIKNAFKDGALSFCPSVRTIWLDGIKEDERARAWAGSDVFISLSDNIQETFGLTLTEAMAAGLPVIATDWDGYRDIVVHEETGFLIKTIMPGPRIGDDVSLAYAAGAIDYDRYIGTVSQYISVNLGQLIKSCVLLIENPDLRKKMGNAGRRRAQEVFDWRIILKTYEDLWSFLRKRRLQAINDKLPQLRGFMADQMDPFQVYGKYPTQILTKDAYLSLRVNRVAVEELLKHPLFVLERTGLNLKIALKVCELLSARGKLPFSGLHQILGGEIKTLAQTLGLLARIGVIEIFAIKGDNRGR